MWDIIDTADGSKTLYNAALNESYHSRHGALQESRHIFLNHGFALLKDHRHCNILEMGFGTGLNALLTLLSVSRQTVHYTSYETAPLSIDVIKALDYTRLSPEFLSLHQAQWNDDVRLTPSFVIEKRNADFLKAPLDRIYDLIYYDAFAPDVQPELWTEEVWKKLSAASQAGTVLVTYCAKGIVRRGLEAAGWLVERLPGPPGKREMLRGIHR